MTTAKSGKDTVVLIGGSPETESGVPLYQLAVGYLVSYARADEELARRYDFEALSFSYGTAEQYDVDRCVKFILDHNPVLVGFSYYIFNAALLSAIAERLKATTPDTLVLFGGPNVSGSEKEKFLARNSFVDFVIAEEGEVAFRQLLHALLDDSGETDVFQSVQNLVYRNNGDIVSTPVGPRMAINEVPSPFLEGILPRTVAPGDPEPKPAKLAEAAVVWETNRGCPYRCSFCYWGDGNTRLSQLPMERLEKEIHLFLRSGVKAIVTADANFGILRRDTDIAELVCRLNAEYGHPLRLFYVEYTKDLKQRHLDIAKLFADNGIENTLGMSFQSLTPEALEAAKRKPLAVGQAKELIARATRNGIPVLTHLIMGLPGESYEEFLAGLDKTVWLGIPIIWLCPLQLLPGTEFDDKREELGLETLQDRSLPFGEKAVISHPKLTRAGQRKMIRIAHAHYMLYNFKTAHFTNYCLDALDGVKPSTVYEAIVEYFGEDEHSSLSGRGTALRGKIKDVIDREAEAHGALSLFVEIPRALWKDLDAAWELYEDFYLRFLPSRVRGRFLESNGQGEAFREVVRFGFLVAPRPTKEPVTESFEHDVGQFFHDVMRHWRIGDVPLPKLEQRRTEYRFYSPEPGRPAKETSTHWARFGERYIWRFDEIPAFGSASKEGKQQPAEVQPERV